MGNILVLVACFLFTLTAPSFALPFSIRSTVEDGNHLTATVSAGIVIAICVIFIIPLLWCAYKLGTRTRQNPMPLFVTPPPIFPTTPSHDCNSNIPSSGQITLPHPAHKKAFRPTFRA